MDRRNYLIGLGGSLIVLSGCTTDAENNGGEDNGGGDNDKESPPLTEYIEFLDHEFRPAQVGSGILLEVTIENVSDIELGLIRVSSNLYVDNERVDDASLTIADLPAGVSESDDMGLVETSPDLYDEITHYDITISTRNEDSEEFEKTYEFDEFDYPPDN